MSTKYNSGSRYHEDARGKFNVHFETFTDKMTPAGVASEMFMSLATSIIAQIMFLGLQRIDLRATIAIMVRNIVGITMATVAVLCRGNKRFSSDFVPLFYALRHTIIYFISFRETDLDTTMATIIGQFARSFQIMEAASVKAKQTLKQREVVL